jgi:NAD(P)H-hydrate epimerase
MIIAELNSEYLGVSQFQLMEVAGANVANEIIARYSKDRKNPLRIHVIAGPGKNGGDGFTAARHLASQGNKVKITLVGRINDVKDESTRRQLMPLLEMNDTVEFETLPDSSELRPVESDVILDAVLGTGVRGDLRQPLLSAVRIINRSKGVKVALDLPSGLDTDSGEPRGDAVKADLTLSLHKIKIGLTKHQEYSGTVVAVPIGIPEEAETYAGPGDFKTIWKQRPPGARKGNYGKLLVIGGSENFTGAPAFSALAATKCGTDLVYVASPSRTSEIVASYSPDLINIKLQGEHFNPKNIPELERWIKTVDMVVLGPGIGLHGETQDTIDKLISMVENANKSLLLDADALKVFGRYRRKLKTKTVLTPHTGEFAGLLQRQISTEQGLRAEAVIQLAKETNSTVVLKGSIDIIASEDRTKFNRTGNPYMTVGGTGDVLTGIIGGLVAQHIDVFHAAVAGTFLNGLAGDILVQEKSPTITPLALVDHIPRAIKYCIEGPPYRKIQKKQ